MTDLYDVGVPLAAVFLFHLAPPHLLIVLLWPHPGCGARPQGQVTACKTNLKNRMYEQDHHAPPASLAELVPDYLHCIPTCPAAGRDTCSEGDFLACHGIHHREVDIEVADFPRINPDGEVVERP